MAVAILEEVNNNADAEFKRLKDIGGGHTIYQNERNGSGWNTWSEIGKNRIEKKKLPVGGRWVGSVRPPETQVFFFWPYLEEKGHGWFFQ